MTNKEKVVVKELVENNIGDMHIDFQEIHGFKNKFTSNAQLPEYFHTHGGKWFGISNKANTAPRIMAKTEEMIDAYGRKYLMYLGYGSS